MSRPSPSLLTLFAILLTVVVAVIASAQPAEVPSGEVPIAIGRVLWHSYTNPSKGRDVPYSVCGDGDWIYVVGSEVGGLGLPIPRIEKRLKSDGSLISVWRGENTPGEFKDCVVLDRRVYAVGYAELQHGVRSWLIAVFDEDLALVNMSVRRGYTYWGEAVAVSVLRGSIYVAGLVNIEPSDIQWRVEKLLPNLLLVSSYDTNPSNTYDMLLCFDANPATENIWVVGLNGLTGHWRVEVLDEDLNRRHIFEKEMPGYGLPNAIAFDERGFAYVAGAGIAVFNDRAELVHVTTTLGYCPKIAYSDEVLYLFCTSIIGGYNRHVLYVIDRQDFIAFTSILSGNINAHAYLANGRVHTDERSLYVSGYVELEDGGGWIVYSVEKVPSQIPIEYVVTEPYTTTVTVTIGFRDLVEQIKRETPTPTTIPEALPQQSYPTQHEAEQKPLAGLQIVILTAIVVVVLLPMVYLVTKKKL